MSTSTLLSASSARPTVSFELFPPRRPELGETIWQRVMRMAEAQPDFFSVTYGASGSSREASAVLVQRLLQQVEVPTVALLTCVGAPREEIAALVHRLLDAGVRDFLALRGDPPAGHTVWRAPAGGLSGSSELVTLIREAASERSWGDHPGAAPSHDISVAVAAYPCGASHSRQAELLALKEKQAAGADFAITQVFYEAEAYISLVAAARRVGVDIPIVPGIIPMTDLRRLRRLSELTGVDVPYRLEALLDIDDEGERHLRGLQATVDLIDSVLNAGAPGLHLYTFNRDRPALDVVEQLRARGLSNPAMTTHSDSAVARPVPTH